MRRDDWSKRWSWLKDEIILKKRVTINDDFIIIKKYERSNEKWQRKIDKMMSIERIIVLWNWQLICRNDYNWLIDCRDSKTNKQRLLNDSAINMKYNDTIIDKSSLYCWNNKWSDDLKIINDKIILKWKDMISEKWVLSVINGKWFDEITSIEWWWYMTNECCDGKMKNYVIKTLQSNDKDMMMK